MALPAFLVTFLKAQSTAAANTALASEPIRTTVTAAEVRAASSSTVRAFTPARSNDSPEVPLPVGRSQ